MRVKILGLLAIFIMAAMGSTTSAFAGSCQYTAHCVSQESGVYVYRGKHAPSISTRAIALQAEQARQAKAARDLAAVNRLKASIDRQNAEIAALRTQVAEGQRVERRRPRRRVYYGNPAFFGRNGFVGNRFFSGATVPLPHPQRPRRPRPKK